MYSTQWEIQTKVEIIWWGKSTNSSHPTAKRNVHEYSSQTEIQAWSLAGAIKDARCFEATLFVNIELRQFPKAIMVLQKPKVLGYIT
jgi:hypothetical protein